MPIKPNGTPCNIREQIIEDLVTGLTFQFETVDDGTTRLRIYGNSLPFGNRVFTFDNSGAQVAMGVAVTNPGRASWIKKISI